MGLISQPSFIQPVTDGYGKLNAGKFVELAQSWKLVKPQAWIESDIQSVVTPEDGAGQFITSEGVSHAYSVTADALKAANLERLEHVTVQLWVDHARRGDVEVELTSPKGVISVLARTRRSDEATTGFRGWKFMSMKHWCARSSSRSFTRSAGADQATCCSDGQGGGPGRRLDAQGH